MASDLEKMKVTELRQEAKAQGIKHPSKLKKQELIDALRGAGGGTTSASSTTGATGAPSRKVVNSPDDREDYPGQTLVTRNRDVIRWWAEERDAKPASVPGSQHDGHPGVLRFDFPGYGGEGLEKITWDDWFSAFDARNLEFVFQEHTSDGNRSNFFRLDNPDRDDG